KALPKSIARRQRALRPSDHRSSWCPPVGRLTTRVATGLADRRHHGGEVSSLKNLALDLSVERFNRSDKQTSDTLGPEATGRGRAVTDQCLPGLINYLKSYHPHGGARALLWDVLVRVEPDRLAAAILSGAIRIIGRIGNDDDDDDDNNDATLRAAMEEIGTNIERECRSARLLKKNAEGYARLDWDIEQLHHAGGWGVDVLFQALPGMFELVLDGPNLQ